MLLENVGNGTDPDLRPNSDDSLRADKNGSFVFGCKPRENGGAARLLNPSNIGRETLRFLKKTRVPRPVGGVKAGPPVDRAP
jgi:hypothetical protein